MHQVIELRLSPADLALFIAGLYKQGLVFAVKQDNHAYRFTITGY